MPGHLCHAREDAHDAARDRAFSSSSSREQKVNFPVAQQAAGWTGRVAASHLMMIAGGPEAGKGLRAGSQDG